MRGCFFQNIRRVGDATTTSTTTTTHRRAAKTNAEPPRQVLTCPISLRSGRLEFFSSLVLPRLRRLVFNIVRGHYVGIHTSNFRDFILKPELLRAVVDCGFEHPSEG